MDGLPSYLPCPYLNFTEQMILRASDVQKRVAVRHSHDDYCAVGTGLEFVDYVWKACP